MGRAFSGIYYAVLKNFKRLSAKLQSQCSRRVKGLDYVKTEQGQSKDLQFISCILSLLIKRQEDSVLTECFGLP